MTSRRSLLWAFRLVLVLCACGAAWSVWHSALAQVAGGTTATPTNAAPVGPNAVDRLAEVVAARSYVKDHRNELSFGLSEVAALQPVVLGNPLWQYVISLVYFVLAFAVSSVVDRFFKHRLKSWAGKTPTQWDDVLVRLADGPVRMICFVLLANVGLRFLTWPAVFERFLGHLTFVIVLLALGFVALRAVDAVINLWSRRIKLGGDPAFSGQFLLLVGKAVKVIIGIVGLLTLLQNLGFDITALLGSVSVLGLALGLAAQDTVANLFGAVAVFMDRPFKVGDRIRIGTDVDGVVEEMGLRATRVRTLDGFLMTVPNKQVGSNTVTNITARKQFRAVFNLGLTYDTPAPRVRRAVELVKELCAQQPGTVEYEVYFDRFGDFFLNLNVTWKYGGGGWAEYVRALESLNLQIKERFDAEKLEFAFPTQTVLLPGQAAPLPPGPGRVMPPSA
jgi:MscS family membrane protein